MNINELEISKNNFNKNSIKNNISSVPLMITKPYQDIMNSKDKTSIPYLNNQNLKIPNYLNGIFKPCPQQNDISHSYNYSSHQSFDLQCPLTDKNSTFNSFEVQSFIQPLNTL
ncbi:hypothetical protein PIROE2DRAFT_18216, partial [Piromyces sp. E2]